MQIGQAARRPLLLLLLVFSIIGVPVDRAAAQATTETDALPTNRRLTDTAPFLPEHYERRLARFEAEPVEEGRVVFLGNSITEGGDWAALTGDETVLNRGISGDVSFGVLDRLEEITRRRPSKLFLLIGINDIGKDIPESIIAHNVGKIVEQIRMESPQTTVYVQSVLPVDPGFPGIPQHYAKQDQVVRLNRLLREVVAAAEVQFVNIFPLFQDDVGFLDDRFTSDGLHLNGAGYEVWADFLIENGYLD